MAESIVSDIVAKLLEHVGKLALEEIAPYFGGRRKLNKLEQTMMMIQARLLDAKRRGEGEGEEVFKKWLQRLKHVLHRLEDLFEEVTLAKTAKEQMPGGKFMKPVRLLFSKSSPLKINKKVAREAITIMEELTAITSLMDILNFRELPLEKNCVVNVVDSSRETHSFIEKEDVIGRDEDKNKIVAMVLDWGHSTEKVAVIPIVGIGGLGKTTLAQLVFNDDIVGKHFELRCWACISDISSLYELAGKVLMSISGGDYRQLTLDQIQSRLRKAVSGKRFLLVFDDIWDEDCKRWLDLKRFLRSGKHGSKIIVTTRSKVVAKNMGTVEPYELDGLPEDKSWDLFRSLAFKEGQVVGNPNLARIGREIVKKCANVPLAIKTIACLLYSMETEIEWELWETFKDKELRMIEQNENSILSTLKLSYDRLPSDLKQCFAYCSLFPKDHLFSKWNLIYLWIAQGFLGSSSGHQSPEDVGHIYFMQLVRRCFFQDIVFDKDGEIIRCKMHDLVHDLAQHAAGGETLLVDEPTQKISNNIWHVSFYGSPMETSSWLLATKQMRSFFHVHYTTPTWLNLSELFSSLRCLRALYLATFESLPDSLGELKHLRYLKLGSNCEYLPECITRLQNLQTLDLRGCRSLRELPRGSMKLINLRHLRICCYKYLKDMPPGFGQLTSLRSLDSFSVGQSNGLDALATLNHLAGWLTICFTKRCQNVLSEATVGILKDTKLTGLELDWSDVPAGEDENKKDELAMRCLQPPPTLKRLKVRYGKGVRFPSWGMDVFPSLLPNLVKIKIIDCWRCQHLPPMSRLPLLRSLHLSRLPAVEYIENGTEASSTDIAVYFPSLESLTLRDLPELKGWSRGEVQGTIFHPQRQNLENHPSLLPCQIFSCLSSLRIENCQKLKSMPLAPRLGSLVARRIHGKLIKHLLGAEQDWGQLTTSPLHSSYLSTLRSIKIESVPELELLSINLCSLESLSVVYCPDLTDLTVASPTSLRQIHILLCGKLRDISAALQHLAVLEDLRIDYCEKLQSLTGLGCLTRLLTLSLSDVFNLRALPESIRHLTQLRKLAIDHCVELTALPRSFRNLTSLQTLYIWGCPKLKSRCEEPYGQDWPLIQQIPHVDIRY